MLMKPLFFLLITLLGVSGMAEPAGTADWAWAKYGLAPTDNPCAIPVPYAADDWRKRQFEDTKKTDFSGWGKNVVFLGDSITHGWNNLPAYPNGHGARVLKAYTEKYPRVRPYSLGMSSDEPQNTLWQLTAGDLLQSFKSPNAIVLMIGINSLNKKKTPEQVAGGINAIVSYLRVIRPNAKILLLGILPCWGPEAPVREEIKKANRLIHAFADAKNIFYLGFGDKLLTADGNLDPELSYDAIHLTEKGYERWAQIMFPYLDDLVKTGGTGEIWQKPAGTGQVKQDQ